MKKIEQFQITSLMLSGFKSYEESTELVFGNPTVITGGNGRGKSSIADAIAFAVTGCPFFGERGIDRLHNENNPDVAIRMCFVDETGTLHELNRTRRKNRMTITYDGYEIRQLDLADLFGDDSLAGGQSQALPGGDPGSGGTHYLSERPEGLGGVAGGIP